MSEEITRAASHRQLKLFHLENPLTLRFGNEFFRALPSVPGVYFFYGSEGELLYIGQSADLRFRIGSYRHVTPEKHPRRTLRLVSKIARVEWQECATADEAIERERVLLLEHRPPFNRAGVWQGEPWWLQAEARNGCLHLELTREQGAGRFGPFPSSFRYVFGSLVRCVYRLAFPEHTLASYPHGITSPAVPLSLRLSLPNAETSLQHLTTCIMGQTEELLAKIAALPLPTSESEKEYLQEDVTALVRFAAKAENQSAKWLLSHPHAMASIAARGSPSSAGPAPVSSHGQLSSSSLLLVSCSSLTPNHAAAATGHSRNIASA